MNHFFKLYPGDYLRDTGHLDTEQHGAYFLCMLHYYAVGPLPLDDAQLRRIMRLELPAYGRVWGVVRKFFTNDGAAWRHRRMDEELASMERAYENRVNGAAITNRKRRTIIDAVTDTNTVSAKQRYSLQPEPEPEPYPEPEKIDQATKLPAGPRSSDKATKPSKLSPQQKEIADALETALGELWVNDAGKWVSRIKKSPSKARRVVAEVCNAQSEGRINTDAARYAEQTWKEFAQ